MTHASKFWGGLWSTWSTQQPLKLLLPIFYYRFYGGHFGALHGLLTAVRIRSVIFARCA